MKKFLIICFILGLGLLFINGCRKESNPLELIRTAPQNIENKNVIVKSERKMCKGDTQSIVEAIENADLSKLKDLVAKGADVNCVMSMQEGCVLDYNPKTGAHGDGICTVYYTFLDIAYGFRKPLVGILNREIEEERSQEWINLLKERYERFKQRNFSAWVLEGVEYSIESQTKELEKHIAETTEIKKHNIAINQIIEFLKSKDVQAERTRFPSYFNYTPNICSEDFALAIYKADVKKVKELIAEGADVNCKVEDQSGGGGYYIPEKVYLSHISPLQIAKIRESVEYRKKEEAEKLKAYKERQKRYEKLKKDKNISAKDLNYAEDIMEDEKCRWQIYVWETEKIKAHNAALDQIVKILKENGAVESKPTSTALAALATLED